jgi:2-polyprenyl-3-methyl-5-hydroxy-6-metoxy-1,4-benzoquinol methylase
MNVWTGQDAAVRGHFRGVSSTWGDRYHAAPKRMSDLDLQLRQSHVQRMLCQVADRAARVLRILDLGCGSGDVLDGLPRDAFQIVGMDLVPEMVAAAARRRPGRAFAAADAHHLPVADAAFDVVTCIGVLEYMPDAVPALAAIRSALKPGGYLIVSFPNKSSLFRTLSKAEIRVERALEAWVRRLRGGSAAEATAPAYRHVARSPRSVDQVMDSVGFETLDWALHSYGLWGRLGRNRLSLAISTWASNRFHRRGWVSTSFASTMVLLARRPMQTTASNR